MISDAFASKYPQLAGTLTAVKSQEENIGSFASVDERAARELADACRDEEEDVGLAVCILAVPPQPDGDLMRFSLAVYHAFGASEDSRIFLGRLWAAAARGWNNEQRAIFLSLLVRDPRETFEALDIAAELFRRFQFTAAEVLHWIPKAYGCVANDMYQKGFWGCVEAFCSTTPHAALTVAGTWLNSRHQTAFLNVICNMIGWLRIAVRVDSALRNDFVALEERLKAPGHPAWRALYIQSWAQSDSGLLISEMDALKMREQYVYPDTEEETAWCLLLSSIMHSEKASWSWADRELANIARPSLSEASKRWVLNAALHGIEAAEQGDGVPADRWLDLFRALLPIAGPSAALWQNVEYALISLAKHDSSAMRALVNTIAANSAQTWLQNIKDQKFESFFRTLNEKSLAQLVSSELCFAPGANSRHLGIVVFDECDLPELDVDVIRSASCIQIELLILESQRREIGYGALARLHACLADRIGQIGENLPELYYEEVATQCMNTYKYRSALAAARPAHEYLQAVVTDVGERLALIDKASQSPALQMQVPGQLRARKLHHRRLVREVSEGVKQRSIFLSLFPSLHMLYGGAEAQLYSRKGALSPPVQMHSSSSSVELPRLEFSDPEGMCLRRLAAASRIAELEHTPAMGDSD